MEIKTVSHRLTSLVVLYDMQTNFFSFALEGLSDNDAHNRLNTKANHIAWLAGSLVEQRYEMAKYFQADPATYNATASAHELFRDNKGIQDDVTYPSLETCRKDWQLITPVLRNVMINATDVQLDANIEMPGMKMSLFDLIAFVIYREANCIGQIALWRRLLGYPAMRYM